MTINNSKKFMMGRRAELMAEMFLQDLKPSFIAKPTPEIKYDFFVGFSNKKGGINNYVVEVKATERPIRTSFPIMSTVYEALSH